MELLKANRIIIDGDFSMVGVTEQIPRLIQSLARLTEDAPAGSGPLVIDMTGIHALDACGCQLLAVFLRSLRQWGVMDYTFKIDASHRELIHILGFDNCLSDGECV